MISGRKYHLFWIQRQEYWGHTLPQNNVNKIRSINLMWCLCVCLLEVGNILISQFSFEACQFSVRVRKAFKQACLISVYRKCTLCIRKFRMQINKAVLLWSCEYFIHVVSSKRVYYWGYIYSVVVFFCWSLNFWIEMVKKWSRIILESWHLFSSKTHAIESDW